MENRRITILALCVLALAFSSGGGAEEGENGWTDSLETRDGSFAFRADPPRVLLIRAGDHGDRDRLFRVRIKGLVVSLRRAESPGPPWKFGASPKNWDGQGDSAELEASDDGKRWKPLGTFHRHAP